VLKAVAIKGKRVPVYIFYGEDDFSMAEALAGLREQVGSPDLLEANSHRVPAARLNLEQLKGLCDAHPFLAQRRLVVVEGLLSLFEPREPRRGGQARSYQPPAGWEGLEDYIKQMPPTTILVFLDGRLGKDNPLLARLEPLAEVRQFPSLRGEPLAQWVKGRAAAKGCRITPGALRLLIRLVGSNLWAMDTELEKLSLYAGSRPVQEEDVRLLVSQAREESIFAAVDAILEERAPRALRIMHRLRQSGEEFPTIVETIRGQLRRVALAKELLEKGVEEREIGSRLNIPRDWVLEKTLRQARSHPWERLRGLYRGLFEVDLAFKRGELEDRLALELLVVELCRPR
jgi:DNA polymerase-3 subunit delta